MLVDDKRYQIRRETWGFRQARYSEDPKGTAALVDIYEERTGKPRRDCVPVAHLRGPWLQTKTEVDARVEADRAATLSAEQQRDRVAAAGLAAVERAKPLGVKAVLAGRHSDPHIELSVDEFVRFLDLVEQNTGGAR